MPLMVAAAVITVLLAALISAGEQVDQLMEAPGGLAPATQEQLDSLEQRLKAGECPREELEALGLFYAPDGVSAEQLHRLRNAAQSCQ
jgi:hypothetical protein